LPTDIIKVHIKAGYIHIWITFQEQLVSSCLAVLPSLGRLQARLSQNIWNKQIFPNKCTDKDCVLMMIIIY